jgi:4-amino-4-deoxy-L-arabinose transferase
MDSNQIDRRLAFGLLGLFLVAYLLPLGVRPLANPDEVRYGEIAREMIASGDWVSPSLNGVRYFEKPILGHWLNAASFELFGMNAFSLRLPSALAAGLSALLIYWLAVSFATRRAALLASGIFLTIFEVFGVGTFAVLDTYLALFLTAALAFYYRAHKSVSSRQKLAFQIACGIACGGAFLTKGFLGLVIPVIVVGPFLLWERRWRAILTDAWIPILAAAAVALPWSVLIHLREPDFWHYFVFVEHIQRFMGEGDAVQHSAPWWYFITALPLVTIPWTPFVWRAWKGIRSEPAHRDFVRYLLFWALLPLAFFSASSGKLMTYILPCFAPISILLAVGLAAETRNDGLSVSRWPAATIAALFSLGFLLLIAVQTSILGEPIYGQDESLASLSMLGALAAGAIVSLLAVRWNTAVRQPVLAGLAVVPLFLALSYSLPASLIDEKAPSEFIESQGPFGPDAILVADSSLFNALAWTLRRDDVYVFGLSEVAYGMSYQESQYRELDIAGLLELLDRNVGRQELVLFTKEERERLFADALPGYGTRAQFGELVLWHIKVSDNPDG